MKTHLKYSQKEKYMNNKIYSFRFLPSQTRVYYIGKKLSQRSNDICVYTEPFFIKERNDTRNSIIAYQFSEIATTKKDSLKEEGIEIIGDSIEELKYLSKILAVPLIVELVKYCDKTDNTVEYTDVFFYWNSSSKN